MRRCSRCGEWKPVDEFSKRRGDSRQSWCRVCSREYQRGRPRLLLAKQLLRKAKVGSCADCGVLYPPYVMDFDHRPGERKVANITVLVKRGAPKAVLLAEMAKCDLVCANCHRERTYQRTLAKDKAAQGSAAVAQW